MRSESDRIAAQIQANGANALTTEQFWQGHRTALEDVLAPVIANIAAFGVDRGKASLSSLPTSVNWDLVNSNASEWARKYTYDLVSGITDTTRAGLRGALSGWIEKPAPLPDLIKRIDDMGVFGPARSQMIAVTEATRVYAEGNSQAWEAAGAMPALLKAPLHVRCRCFMSPRRLPSGEFVIVWQTGLDDIVCPQPGKKPRSYPVPWGTVNGCRALHKVVVSQGPYLGMAVDDAIGKAKVKAG